MKTYLDLELTDFEYEISPAVGHLLVFKRDVYKITDIYHYNGETGVYCECIRRY